MPNYATGSDADIFIFHYRQTQGRIEECKELIAAILHRQQAHEASNSRIITVFRELVADHADSEDAAMLAMVAKLRDVLGSA